jgi:transcriptional regulator with XRE-family HTH domain
VSKISLVAISKETKDEKKAAARALGYKLRARRDELGLTQIQLATKAGLTQGEVSSVENGKRNLPVHRLQLLAGALEWSLNELAVTSREISFSRQEQQLAGHFASKRQ